MSVIFSEARPTREGWSAATHPHSQGHQGYWFGPVAAPRLVPARQGAQPEATAGQPQPATAEELTRDLAGWSLPPAAPLGRASPTWLW